MHAELVGLPAFGVDVHGAFDNLDSVIAELTRAPKRDDPPDVTQLLIDNRAVFSKFRDLYHSRPYFDKIDYCERLINYLVAYACKVISACPFIRHLPALPNALAIRPRITLKLI